MIYKEPYDSSKSIFKPKATRQSPRTQLRPRPRPRPSSRPSSSEISSSNLVGTWKVNSLFGIPFPKSSYSLGFTSTTINLLGGCNSYRFPYTLNDTTQIITIDKPTSTKKACSNSDDGLFVSGVEKMHKYLISKTSLGYNLNFYDKPGKAGYSLTLQSGSSNSPSRTTPSKVKPFGNGVVLFLLLKRRDLPRAVGRISGNALTYTGCNTITHSFKIGDPTATEGKINIKGGPSTRKNCASSTDSVYIKTLNSVVSYVYDSSAKTTIFKDRAG